jgi:hypothetical protein
VKIAALAFLVALPICRAEDWTVDGKDYHNVKAGEVESDRVHITYDGGLGTVPLADLPPDLQRRFGYDAKQAKALARAAEERQAQIDNDPVIQAQREAARLAQVRRVEINQVTPSGLLVSPMYQEIENGYLVWRTSDRMVFIHSKFNEDFVDGDQINVKVYRSGSYSYTSALGTTRTVEQWIAVTPSPSEISSPRNKAKALLVGEPISN